MTAIAYPHLVTTSEGIVYIDDTTTKLVEIVQDHLAHHWGAEDIHREYPYLGLAQIHAALAYYYDHQAETDAEIERRSQRVSEIRARRQDSKIREQLKDLGHLP